MLIISAVNQSDIDWNLLNVLHVVLEERSATRAAKRLHVTQSAVSNALRRARRLFGDPLVVRDGAGLSPTTRALAIAPRIAEAVRAVKDVLGAPAAFEPAACEREFVLSSPDPHFFDVARLSADLAAAMPRARLAIVSVDYLVAQDGLATGKVDVALAPRPPSGALEFDPIDTTFAMGLVRKDHPGIGRKLTRALYNSLSHVDVRVALGVPGLGSRLASIAAKQAGCERRIVLVVPSFTSAALVAAGTDLVAMVPHRMATNVARVLPVRAVSLPFEVPVELGLVWHRHTEEDPAARAFRAIVRASLRASE